MEASGQRTAVVGTRLAIFPTYCCRPFPRVTLREREQPSNEAEVLESAVNVLRQAFGWTPSLLGERLDAVVRPAAHMSRRFQTNDDHAVMTRHAGGARSGASSCTPTPPHSTSSRERERLRSPWPLEPQGSRTRPGAEAGHSSSPTISSSCSYMRPPSPVTDRADAECIPLTPPAFKRSRAAYGVPTSTRPIP